MRVCCPRSQELHQSGDSAHHAVATYLTLVFINVTLRQPIREMQNHRGPGGDTAQGQIALFCQDVFPYLRFWRIRLIGEEPGSTSKDNKQKTTSCWLPLLKERVHSLFWNVCCFNWDSSSTAQVPSLSIPLQVASFMHKPHYMLTASSSSYVFY